MPRPQRPPPHRLNSTKDPHYAAAPKEEIEPNFYLVGGSPKRLFDRDDVTALFCSDWKIEHAAERTSDRYGGEKTLWEIVARNPRVEGPRRPTPRAR